MSSRSELPYTALSSIFMDTPFTVHRPQFSGSAGLLICSRDLLDNSDKIAISAWFLKLAKLGLCNFTSYVPRLVIGICGSLTVSYEVPEVLVPVATAVQPILENLLRGGLERFAKLAESTLAD